MTYSSCNNSQGYGDELEANAYHFMTPDEYELREIKRRLDAIERQLPAYEVKHCKDCRFWDLSSVCEMPEFHACNCPLCNHSPDPGGFTGGDGGEPFNCGHFASSALFGCVHWQAK